MELLGLFRQEGLFADRTIAELRSAPVGVDEDFGARIRLAPRDRVAEACGIEPGVAAPVSAVRRMVSARAVTTLR